MIRDLFEDEVQDVRLAPGAMLLRGFAQRFEAACVTALRRVVEVAPFRHMVTPSDVGRDDQLRDSRVGHRSDRLPLRQP